MPKLPVCSGEDAIKAFIKDGWLLGRQKGSHVTLYKTDSFVVLTIPLHDTLDKGLLRSQIKKAGMSVEQFTRLNRNK